MKKKWLATLVALAVSGASLSALAGQTGNLVVHGKVVESTCSLEGDAGNVQVTLPNIDKSLLKDPGSNSGVTPFSVKVAGCTTSNGKGADVVSLAFAVSGTVDDNGNLANTDQGGASGVAVQLLDKDNKTINIRTDTYEDQIARGESTDVDGGDVNLKYFARYYSAAGNAGAGDVLAVAQFQLVYQ